MELSGQELLEVYEGVVKPFEHPDPLGYMTRAVITSGGDPDFVGDDERIGFMPVNPAEASRMVNVTNVQELQSNLIATLTMDRMLFDKFQSVDDMVVAFHFGEEAVNQDERTTKQNEFLSDISDNRELTYELMYPPFATTSDVIKLLQDDMEITLSKEEKDFFELLLTEG